MLLPLGVQQWWWRTLHIPLKLFFHWPTVSSCHWQSNFYVTALLRVCWEILVDNKWFSLNSCVCHYYCIWHPGQAAYPIKLLYPDWTLCDNESQLCIFWYLTEMIFILLLHSQNKKATSYVTRLSEYYIVLKISENTRYKTNISSTF